MDSSSLLLLPMIAPLLGALALALPASRSATWTIVLIASAVSAAALLFLPGSMEFGLPSFLFGGEFGVDPESRPLLLVTAAIWFAGALYAAGEMRHDLYRRRFAFCFLLAMAGNIGLILARDMASFFALFALMSFTGFGLIVHNGDYAARRAARVYIVFVIVGEIALFIGLALAFDRSGSLALPIEGDGRPSVVEIVVLLIGFGIKAGLLGLHMWLPLAHPAAPAAASAILSGAMLKAGIIGLMRFLPPGEVMAPEIGNIVTGLGIAGAFFAALMGVTQRNPKTLLAYSSVSQLGLVLMIFGLVLIEPGLGALATTILILFSAHHGLVKAALFIGVGIAKRPLEDRLTSMILMTFLAIAALSLIGVAPTSGYLAKSMLDEAAGTAAGPWSDRLPVALTIASLGTTALMVRLMAIARSDKLDKGMGSGPLERLAFLGLIAAGLSLPWLIAPGGSEALIASMRDGWTKALWPILLVVAIAGFLWLMRFRLAQAFVAGDFWRPIGLLVTLVGRHVRRARWIDDPITHGVRQASQAGARVAARVRMPGIESGPVRP